MTDSQAPTPADMRRAAALYLHHHHRDITGINAILAEATEADRTSALILAVIKVATLTPGTILATDEGVEGLQRVVMHMFPKEDEGE